MAGQLTIWGRANSVNVQKVLWCLAELDLSQTSVDLVLETRGPDHMAELRETLAAAGYDIGEA